MDSIFAAIATVITATGAAIAGVLIAMSKYRAAEAINQKGARLLRRLWDWMIYAGYADQVPKPLRAAIEKFLAEEVKDDDHDREARQ